MNARRPILAIITVVACTAAAGAQGHGQDFFFVEETASRLPPDTTLPGTSSTDVDLVDVDADGDLDLFVAEGTDRPAPRPNRLLLNNGIGVFTDVSATHLPPGLANSLKADFGDIDGDGDRSGGRQLRRERPRAGVRAVRARSALAY